MYFCLRKDNASPLATECNGEIIAVYSANYTYMQIHCVDEVKVSYCYSAWYTQ